MTKKAKVRIRLLLAEVRDGGYYHLNASVVEIIESERLRNTDEANGLRVADLLVSSQGSDEDRQKHEQGRHLYAWDVTYQAPYSVDLHIAQAMVRTLKHIGRKLERLAREHGRAVSFAQYLGRVALALGAEGFVIETGTGTGSGSCGYAANTYRFLSMAEGIDHASDLIVRWQKGA